MSSLPITPPKARVDPAPSRSASPPGGSSGEDFAALLSQTTNQARTAPAEGRNTRPAPSDQARRRDDDDRAARTQRPDDAKTDAPKASDDATQSQTTKDATDPNAGRNGDQPDGQDSKDASAQTQGNPNDANAAASTAAAAAAAASTAPVPPATQGLTGKVVADGGVKGQSAQPQQAVVATDVAAQAALAAATDAKPAVAGDGRLQLPAGLLDPRAAGRHAAKDIKISQNGAVTDGLPPAPTLAPTATAAAQAGAGAGQQGGAGNNPNNGAAAQAQPATPPTVAVAQPTATPFTVVPTAAGSGVGGSALTKGSVVQTAERVQDLVRIATTRAGNARATLQLRPEALGQVDVQLRTTKDGLVATIAAHDQAGLDALQNAAGELKRTLEDRGVQLHSLDLQLGAGAGSGFSNQGDARQASSGQGGRNASYGLDGEDADDELELTISRTPSIPAGELVDVTA